MVPLTATGPEVFVATMDTFLPDSYDDLGETITHMKSLKLKSYSGNNVKDCRAGILVDDEHLKSDRAFNPEHLGYITRIFEDTYDSRLCPWEIHKYKDITELIKNFICVAFMSYYQRSSSTISIL